MLDYIKIILGELRIHGFSCAINTNITRNSLFDIIAFNENDIKIIKTYEFYSYAEMNEKIKYNKLNFLVPSNVTKEIWCYIKQYDKIEIMQVKGRF